MNLRDYRVVYSCYKEGYEWTDEDIVKACSCADAIEKIRDKCADNYASCDVISVEKVDSVYRANEEYRENYYIEYMEVEE